MPQLTPVEHDPFDVQYKPVEHDPWGSGPRHAIPGDVNAMMPEAYFDTRKGIPDIGARLVADLATDFVTSIGDFMDAGKESALHITSPPTTLSDSDPPWQDPLPAAAARVALNLVGNGMGMAERGAAGIFGGRLMRTANPEKYALAERLESAGSHPQEILRETGLARGAERAWKQEIDDSSSTLKTTQVPPGGVPLSDVIDHPELFEAYPDLKHITVGRLEPEIEDTGVKAQAAPNGVLMGSRLSPQEFKSVLLHELQHVVQYKEYFALGDNPLNHIAPALAKAKEDFIRVRDTTEKELARAFPNHVEYMKDVARNELLSAQFPVPPAAAKTVSEAFKRYPNIKERVMNIVKSELLLAKAEDVAWVKYRRAMGEAEARNVSERMDYSPEQRRTTLPVSTEDVPRFLQHEVREKPPTFKPVEHDPFNEVK